MHHDDVADALVAATLGVGPPGAYNLAGDGTITLGDLARALGRLAYPVPRFAARPGRARRTRAPLVPTLAQWVNAGRVPVVMDTTQGAPRARAGARAIESREILGELVASQT